MHNFIKLMQKKNSLHKLNVFIANYILRTD